MYLAEAPPAQLTSLKCSVWDLADLSYDLAAHTEHYKPVGRDCCISLYLSSQLIPV